MTITARTAITRPSAYSTTIMRFLDLPIIKLNKSAHRQFKAIYANIGKRVLCSVRLRLELGEYIRYREESDGEPLDTLGQTLRIDEHLAVCLMKIHGQWIITDVWELAPVVAFVPIHIWKRFKEGANEVVRSVVVAWRYPVTVKPCDKDMPL